MLAFNQSFDGSAPIFNAWRSGPTGFLGLGGRTAVVLNDFDLRSRNVSKMRWDGAKNGKYSSTFTPSSSCPRVSAGYWF